jgi:hypothetical protein
MWSGTPRRTRGACVSRGGHEAKRLTIQVEGNWLGIDPHVTPGGRGPGRRSEPGGPPSPPLEGKWELITDVAEGKPCSLRPLFSGAAATGRTDCGPDPVDCRPLSRPNPPLPQWEQQLGRGG